MKKAMLLTNLLLALTPSMMQAQGKEISADEARKIALAKIAGEVKEVERENENGQDIFSVEILKDGKVFEVHIDPKSGKVLKVDQEGADSKHE